MARATPSCGGSLVLRMMLWCLIRNGVTRLWCRRGHESLSHPVSTSQQQQVHARLKKKYIYARLVLDYSAQAAHNPPLAKLTKRKRSASELSPASWSHFRTQASCSAGVSNTTPDGNTFRKQDRTSTTAAAPPPPPPADCHDEKESRMGSSPIALRVAECGR